MHCFPIVRGHHLDRIPGTTIKESAIRAFADTFLATDTEIWIDFDAPEWRMVLVGYPEHARFNRAVLDAGRRTGAARAAVSRYSKYARFLLASCFAVAYRHGPMFFNDVVHTAVVRIQKSGFGSRNKTIGRT